ncbi:MAG: PhoH family protein [Clostridia bacterium]|nr:PhoH family protein [Clostridia bacterium]MBQ1895675.1 PhoH family protein [Clostridia bacterium]MBQ2091700.1 PhoH family protein [Clostridia bacterium]MBQ3897851.1 PhoH family protein [Clostridia bacterium]
MSEKLIQFDNFENVLGLFGSLDENIRILENEYGVTVITRGDTIKITGDEAAVEAAAKSVDGLFALLSKGEELNEQNVRYVIEMTKGGQDAELKKLMSDCICITASGKPIKAKTLGQKRYIDAINDNTVVFGIGPAGTGKTYLAVAMAVKAFKAKEVNRIILTRPAVEAGESLGFLPGDLQQKVDPYLRPLYDALFEMFGADGFQKQMERGVIEVAPLAYMRGRTLDESFIILDEAQNTTSEQMKMFLTRLGNGSKAVITGDVTQIDLPGGKKSGLVEVTKILKNIEGITTVKFDERDVVRHHLVQEIVKAYERYAEKTEGKHRGK